MTVSVWGIFGAVELLPMRWWTRIRTCRSLFCLARLLSEISISSGGWTLSECPGLSSCAMGITRPTAWILISIRRSRCAHPSSGTPRKFSIPIFLSSTRSPWAFGARPPKRLKCSATAAPRWCLDCGTSWTSRPYWRRNGNARKSSLRWKVSTTKFGSMACRRSVIRLQRYRFPTRSAARWSIRDT